MSGTIAEACEITGLTERQVRYWCSHFQKIRGVGSGYTVYLDGRQMSLLLTYADLIAAGFTPAAANDHSIALLAQVRHPATVRLTETLLLSEG